MRIAILTLPLHTNYGGILQAYALQTVLERMGHKVDVLDKKRRIKTQLPTSVKIKRFILKNILFQDIAPLGEDVAYKRRKFENKHTWKFADKYINRREISSFEEIKEGEYDAIVVGSDQVWRPQYFKNHYKSINDAYLAFANNWRIKRIAFAPSFGTDIWEYSNEETKECAELLKQFDYISLREQSGVELCKTYFNVDAHQLLDPTLLLDVSDYIKLFKNKKIQSRKGILCYFLDYNKDKELLIKETEKILDMPSFTVNSRVEDCNNYTTETQPPVEKWLKGFYDAEFILTDSFHACIFSIIFDKPFIVYGNKERGITRIKSLLKTFNIEKRLIENSAEIFTFKNSLHDKTPLKQQSINKLYTNSLQTLLQ